MRGANMKIVYTKNKIRHVM